MCALSPNVLAVQLGAVVFPILVLYLIMVTSNRELQKATKQQVDVFISELRSVDSELKNVTSELQNVSATLQGLRQVMERQTATQEAITAIEQAETAKRVMRMKPILQARMLLTGWNFLFDLRQHRLLIYNSGGDASEVFASVTVAPLPSGSARFGPSHVSPNSQIALNVGPPNAFGGVTSLFVHITCRDAERREYHGVAQVLLGGDWSVVPLVLVQ
jgi:hypothetical protein